MSHQTPSAAAAALQEGLAALRRDLVHEDGPRISTMRNYRFAILQYDPRLEFAMRAEVQSLVATLGQHGWHVLPIDLDKLLLDRVRADPDWAERVAATERRMAAIAPGRGLDYLKSKLEPLIEGPDGLAADCSRLICDYADRHPGHADRLLAIIGRAGALYPFFRSSALLKHLDGQTRHVPVVLLYPGKRVGQTGLSFMDVLPPDHDYRPRIYP